MNNEEINEAVAIRLGWRRFTESKEFPEHWTQDNGISNYWCLPAYSTAIHAAWEAVANQGYFKIVKSSHGWEAVMGINYPGVCATADTAPLAICLAFLKLPDGKSV